MEKFVERTTDEILGLLNPEKADPRGIDKDNFFFALDKESIGGEFNEAAIALFAGMKSFDCMAALNAKLGLTQGAMDGGWQRCQAMLEDEISGASFEGFDGHFLAEGACDEDERNIGRLLLSDGEGAEAIESWQAMIGENEGRMKSSESVKEIVLSIHSFKRELEAALFKGVLDESGIALVILDHQNAEFLFDKPEATKTYS